MGVPKFYRWISERYPCLSEVVREYQIPEFDNLYLDMNGIIHICSHPNDEDPHFRISEEKIFADIFHYIEILFRLIRPRKVFFMAVDGVAPRAKMNQQRGRRFRSAREAETAEKKAIERGETLPTEARFDSNCITPGTEFMAKLHTQLQYFVNNKVSTDKTWQGLRIYLSGHNAPGEGEHKIMDFIRGERANLDHDPNTRHCLYGLDADLIMLGLCSHEPHFSLLREEVRFGSKKSQKRTPVPEETTFHLLHLSLLREYLDMEFSSLRDKLSFPYDKEHVIDDWVLMGFLVGNDFIPHLPHMHIHAEALSILYKVYMDVLPTLDGYLNEDGHLNLPRFEKFLQHLSKIDYENFNETYADLKWFEGKKTSGKSAQLQSKRKRNTREGNLKEVKVGQDSDGSPASCDSDEWEDVDDSEVSSSGEEPLFEMEFMQHKRDYYMNKLEYAEVTEEVLRDQAEGYVRAIQWNLHYYYNGVCSWSWYYPHHYAPFISDVKGFSNFKLEFDLGQPFKPFQQLLAVLPALSKNLLPRVYQGLMCDDNSPLIEYYPMDFKTDLNGKRQDWEAVVLIPFIDETRLIEAMEPLDSKLSNEERFRNSHGPVILSTFSETSLGKYKSSVAAFPDIEFNHSKCEEISKDYWRIPVSSIRKGLLPGVRVDVFFPGFPTFHHLPYKFRLSKEEVKVFQMNSRGENMIVSIVHKDRDEEVESVAQRLVGKQVWIGWPHLMEAKVVGVATQYNRCVLDSERMTSFKTEVLQEKESKLWRQQVSGLRESQLKRWGIEVGDIDILVYTAVIVGRKYVHSTEGRITLEKMWATIPQHQAYQTIVTNIQTQDSSFQQFLTVEELFPPNSVCFNLAIPYYGHMGKVIEVDPRSNGTVRVKFQTPIDLSLTSIIKKQELIATKYLPAYHIAQRLGINTHLVSRITGSLFVIPGTRESSVTQGINIGLNLKFNKRNQEVPGFTRKFDEQWQYSARLLDVLSEYLERFPDVFEYVTNHAKDDLFYEQDVFTGQSTLKQVQDWIKSMACSQLEPQTCGMKLVDEEVIKAIEEEINKSQQIQSKKAATLRLRCHFLYRPSDRQGSLAPDPSATYELFDRVVNVRDGHTVPLGLRGTVIGLHTADKPADVIYEVHFDKEFTGGLTIRSSPSRCYRMPPYALINLSYGLRKNLQDSQKDSQKPTAIVLPQTQGSESNDDRRPWILTKSGGEEGRSNRKEQKIHVNKHRGQQQGIQQARPYVMAAAGFPGPAHPFHYAGGQPILARGHHQQFYPGFPPPPRPPFMAPSNYYTPPFIKVPPPTGQRFEPLNHSPTSPFQPRQSSGNENEFFQIWQQLERAGQSGRQEGVRHGTSEHRGSGRLSDKAVDEASTLLEMTKINLSGGRGAYSQQVSVEELFKGAREAEKSRQTVESVTVLKKDRARDELLDLVQQQTGCLPIYTYTKLGENFSAVVTLPSGESYCSGRCPSKEGASEDAARTALQAVTGTGGGSSHKEPGSSRSEEKLPVCLGPMGGSLFLQDSPPKPGVAPPASWLRGEDLTSQTRWRQDQPGRREEPQYRDRYTDHQYPSSQSADTRPTSRQYTDSQSADNKLISRQYPSSQSVDTRPTSRQYPSSQSADTKTPSSTLQFIPAQVARNQSRSKFLSEKSVSSSEQVMSEPSREVNLMSVTSSESVGTAEVEQVGATREIREVLSEQVHREDNFGNSEQQTASNLEQSASKESQPANNLEQSDSPSGKQKLKKKSRLAINFKTSK